MVGQCQVKVFADDTCVMYGNDDINIALSTLQNDLDNINAWFKCNELTLNASKTNYVLFHQTNKKIPNDIPKVHVNDIEIKRVPSAKYIGLTIDEKLSWHEHVTEVEKTMIKMIRTKPGQKYFYDSYEKDSCESGGEFP